MLLIYLKKQMPKIATKCLIKHQSKVKSQSVNTHIDQGCSSHWKILTEATLLSGFFYKRDPMLALVFKILFFRASVRFMLADDPVNLKQFS